MKYLLLLSLVIIAIDSLYGLKACTGNSKCEEDECCKSLGLPPLLGHCSPRGKAGGKCHVNKKEILSKYYMFCPCGEGLECKPEK
uniref:hypothetical protein n=1 Tax=Staphylococcus aureus TaxID=1280 RepID=UPI0038B400A0